MTCNEPIFVLDDARSGTCEVYGAPVSIIAASEAHEVPVALDAMQLTLDKGHHLAGYISYELGYAIEPRLRSLLPGQRKLPLFWFGVHDEPPATHDTEGFLRTHSRAPARTTHLAFEWTRAQYRERFAAVLEAIAAGDIYQANLSMRARFRLQGDPLDLYRRLREASSSSHAAFVTDGTRHILSMSPELFFDIDPSGTIRTRPMKGTAPRGREADEDDRFKEALAASQKNRAENLMIVDLIRNDLGKLARTGSIAVEELFHVETYPTVHQMVSTVTGRLPERTSVRSILDALFPCGSITGAPKIRAMEIIRSLETSARGVYCGAVGFFSPQGRARFNVAIRTLTVEDGYGELGVGGAIVSDSDADAEFDECLLKARYFEMAHELGEGSWRPGVADEVK
ncbi:aminodeoxychorismate synthase component I [Xanthomonas citri]|uniref:aminodeoxychorismate synthase component I n=1 Tax=Xanthomonas citri TaxID=346 RepID=UPI0009B6E315|nr:aminodeoxychorismate synthase component I [Xanthomonas citri]